MENRALFGLGIDSLTELMAGLGQKPYRARQVFDALYRQRVRKVDEITTLSAELRTKLTDGGWVVGLPELVQTAVSVDGTERYVVQMADGETVETVWMPDGDGGFGSEFSAEDETEEIAAGAEVGTGFVLRGEARRTRMPSGDEKRTKPRQRFGALAEQGYRRATICVSSQVGCAVNCQFCLTAKLGIKRNLTAGEIAGQVVAVLNRHGIRWGRIGSTSCLWEWVSRF